MTHFVVFKQLDIKNGFYENFIAFSQMLDGFFLRLKKLLRIEHQ